MAGGDFLADGSFEIGEVLAAGGDFGPVSEVGLLYGVISFGDGKSRNSGYTLLSLIPLVLH